MLFVRLCRHRARRLRPVAAVRRSRRLDAGSRACTRACGASARSAKPISRRWRSSSSLWSARARRSSTARSCRARRRCGAPASQCPAFGPKDAIALLNANAFSVGHAALDASRCGACARSVDCGRGAVARGIPGQSFAARSAALARCVPRPDKRRRRRRLLRLLAGSDLMDTKNARRVQDPLSFRCLAPVMGAAFDQLARAEAAIDADLNGAGDSPAVLADDGEMLSTVNFDTTALALAFEGLGLALSHAAAIGGVPHRQADVAWLLGPAAVPHARTAAAAPDLPPCRRPPPRSRRRSAISRPRSGR